MSLKNVSVIIPVYNKDAYLDQCLNSLINQSLHNIEIICINDGSTDKSQIILEKFSKKDSRIKVLVQENLGVGSARNLGLKNANGEYIAFVDADDWIEEDALEMLYNDAIRNKSDLVLFDAIELLPNNRTRIRNYYSEKLENVFSYKDYPDLIMNNYLIVCTKLHNRDFLIENTIKFDEKGLFEDVLFHIKSIIKSENISYVNKVLYNYRRTETNTRQSNSIKSKNCMTFLDISNEIKTLLMNESIYSIYEENFFKFKLTEIRNLFNNIEKDYKQEFFELIKKDFNQNPIRENIIPKLSGDLQKFYFSIINSSDIDECNKLLYGEPKKTFFDKLLNIFWLCRKSYFE